MRLLPDQKVLKRPGCRPVSTCRRLGSVAPDTSSNALLTTCVLSGPGRHRWEFMLLPGEAAEAMMDDAVVHGLIRPWDCGPVEIERMAGEWTESGKGTLADFHDALTRSGKLPLGVAARAIGLIG